MPINRGGRRFPRLPSQRSVEGLPRGGPRRRIRRKRRRLCRRTTPLRPPYAAEAPRRYALVLVAGALLAVATVDRAGPATAAAASATGDCTPAASWPAANGRLASQVLTLVNQHRAAMGLGQLVISPTLSASAVWKARHMAAYNYMAHDDPAPPVARTAATASRRAATRSVRLGREHRLRLHDRPVGRRRLARLTRPQGEHREPLVTSRPVSAPRERGERRLLGAGLRHGQRRRLAAADTTTTPPPPPPPRRPRRRRPPRRRRRRPRRPRPTTTTPKTTTTTPATTSTTTARIAAADEDRGSGGDGTGADRRSRRAASASRPTGSRSRRTSSSERGRPGTHVVVKCSATAAGRHLRVVVNALDGQAARCAWRVPGVAARQGRARLGSVTPGGRARATAVRRRTALARRGVTSPRRRSASFFGGDERDDPGRHALRPRPVDGRDGRLDPDAVQRLDDGEAGARSA